MGKHADIVRQLETLQDQWETEILARWDGSHDEFQGIERDAWLLGMAVGYANAYREAADLLRGGPRPGTVTFRVAELHRGGEPTDP